MKTSDIHGAKTINTQKKLVTRDNQKTEDINCKSTRMRREEHIPDQNFKDVTAKKNYTRQQPMNPLTPSYKRKDINGKVQEYGHIADSTPKIQYYRKNENDILVNSVKGIALSNTDTTKKMGAFKTKERTDFRKINDVTGIDGAKF